MLKSHANLVYMENWLKYNQQCDAYYSYQPTKLPLIFLAILLSLYSKKKHQLVILLKFLYIYQSPLLIQMILLLSFRFILSSHLQKLFRILHILINYPQNLYILLFYHLLIVKEFVKCIHSYIFSIFIFNTIIVFIIYYFIISIAKYYFISHKLSYF